MAIEMTIPSGDPFGDRRMAGRRLRPEDSMDNDGITDIPRTVRVTVKVRGDGVVVDFTGTDPQVEGPLNSVLGYTASGVYMTIQAATDPTIPPNGGCYRPVEIIAPEGTIVNPHFPAACTGGNEIVSVVHNAVYRALGEIPRDIPNPWADGCRQGLPKSLS